MLAIRLPADIEKRLDRLAKRSGRTKTWYAREAILAHLEDLEDAYLAEKALIAIREGRSRTYTLEEVERSLGLDDHLRKPGKKEPRQNGPAHRAATDRIYAGTGRQTRRSA